MNGLLRARARASGAGALIDGCCAAFVLLAVAYFAYRYAEMGLQRYAIYRAGVDTGTFVQILASAFSGFHSTTERDVNHFAVHFSPILFALAPFMIVTKSTATLIVIEAVATGLTAPALFLLARKRVGPILGAACAAVPLLYPPLAGVTFTDFTESCMEPAAVLWTIWGVDSGNVPAALVLALAALCIKEDVAPGLCFGGLVGWAWFARRGDRHRARLCAAVALLALVVFVGYFQVVRPLLHTGVPYFSFHFYNYSPTYGSPAGFWPLWDIRRWQYIEKIMTPLLWVPLLTPAAVLALPGLVEVVASHEAITMSLETHYAAVWIPYMLFAFVCGVSVLYRRFKPLGAAVVLGALYLSYHTLIYDDPIARWFYLYRLPNAHDAAVTQVLAAFPPDAEIAAPDHIFAHLGFDPNAGLYVGTRYVVIDRRSTDYSDLWTRTAGMLGKPGPLAAYRLLREVDGVQVYERRRGASVPAS